MFVFAEGRGDEELGAAEIKGTDRGAEAHDGAVARLDAADVDDATGAVLPVERTARAFDDVHAAHGDRVHRDEAGEAVFLHAGGDAADQERGVFGVVLGAADAAGGGVELDAGNVFERIADIEGADVAHERRGEHLDVHREVFDGRVVTRARGGVGGAVLVVIFGDDLEDVELNDFFVLFARRGRERGGRRRGKLGAGGEGEGETGSQREQASGGRGFHADRVR